MSYNFQDVPGVLSLLQAFALEEGLTNREIYFYPDELPFGIPEGKVLRITIDYVSLAKLNNVAE